MNRNQTRTRLIGKFFLIFFTSGLLLPGITGAEKSIAIKWDASLEVGRADLLFASIASICEDEKGNFYVLDRIEHKVFKFSRDGQLLFKFGGKGEGPGDFIRPSRITITPQGQVAVADDMYHISFFQPDGIFSKRLQLSNRLGLFFKDKYISFFFCYSGNIFDHS